MEDLIHGIYCVRIAMIDKHITFNYEHLHEDLDEDSSDICFRVFTETYLLYENNMIIVGSRQKFVRTYTRHDAGIISYSIEKLLEDPSFIDLLVEIDEEKLGRPYNTVEDIKIWPIYHLRVKRTEDGWIEFVKK